MFCNSGAPCGSQTTVMLTTFCRGNSAFSFNIPERVALQIFPCQRLPVHTCGHVLEFSFAAVSFLYEAFALGELLLCFQFPFSPVPLPQLLIQVCKLSHVCHVGIALTLDDALQHGGMPNHEFQKHVLQRVFVRLLFPPRT